MILPQALPRQLVLTFQCCVNKSSQSEKKLQSPSSVDTPCIVLVTATTTQTSHVTSDKCHVPSKRFGVTKKPRYQR
eukprot:m.329568 g.329568  ORF g.329568 m.329568 type:complete len:76 (+) comp16038_c0_seq2:6672-6899(+)